MKRLFIIAAITLSCLTAQAQEAQDSLESVERMMKLQEVVVRGNLPNTRLKGNAMITRIQGTALAETGTVQEMLIKVPGMTGSEDNLEVLGKGAPLIYINGRLLRDLSELKRLRSIDVRDVEVINNPGAQYDATVRAVVRIRTKRQAGEGLGLDLSLTDDQDLRYGMNQPNCKLNMNYRQGAVDVFGGVWYSHMDYRQYSTLEETATTTKVFRQTGPYTMTWKNDQLVYTAGANWQISDNHSVGLRTNLTHYLGGKNKVIYDEDVFENNALIDHLYSEQTSKETKPLGWLTNAYYNGTVGKLDIDWNFDFMKTETNTDRENVEESRVTDDFVRSKSGADSRLYATKLVLSYPVWKGTLEAGTEMTFARRHNTYSIDKQTIADTDADIREDNTAAFAEYSCDFSQYGQASIGLRYEHTRFDYDDRLTSDRLHRSQDEWFPTAAYSVTMGKVQAGLSYSIKTDRPSFFAMNDAVTYISRYSMQAGNSQLLNERIHDLTLNTSWRWLTLTASYERTKHPITQWAYLTDGDAALIKHINLSKPIDTYCAYLAATPRVGIWSLNATVGVEKQDFSLDLDDATAPDGKRHASFCTPVWTLNAFNTFLLKHAWKIDVNFMFRSRGHSQNFYNNYDNLRLGLVVQKSFLRDRSLTCRVAVVDIFQRNRRNEFADMGYYQVQQNNRFSTHKLNLALFYRFNATRSKYKGTGAGKAAIKRLQ